MARLHQRQGALQRVSLCHDRAVTPIERQRHDAPRTGTDVGDWDRDVLHLTVLDRCSFRDVPKPYAWPLLETC